MLVSLQLTVWVSFNKTVFITNTTVSTLKHPPGGVVLRLKWSGVIKRSSVKTPIYNVITANLLKTRVMMKLSLFWVIFCVWNFINIMLDWRARARALHRRFSRGEHDLWKSENTHQTQHATQHNDLETEIEMKHNTVRRVLVFKNELKWMISLFCVYFFFSLL